jgi:methylenetetrahydrofolate dehydrogenase (NADP+) / methenyltetrahydrofolate cyclohydrolase
MTEIIDGNAVASEIRSGLTDAIETLADAGSRPGLATVLMGDDPASQTYVNMKQRDCEEVGIESVHVDVDGDAPAEALYDEIAALNDDAEIHGYIVQAPVPDHVDYREVIRRVDPAKDVDGFHPENVAKLTMGLRGGFVPCTPLGCLRLLDDEGVNLAGAHAVVVGRSNIVGKPMASLLLGRHATVTIAHSKTRDLPAITRQADVLVAAVGRARMLGAAHVKPGAIVIDVGINKGDDGRLCGDVDTAAVMGIAAAVTPVPGGVGPMTIAMLLQNTLTSFDRATSAST